MLARSISFCADHQTHWLQSMSVSYAVELLVARGDQCEATVASATTPPAAADVAARQQQQRSRALELLKNSLWAPRAVLKRPELLARLEGALTAAEQVTDVSM